LQISRFTASKPSKSAIASVEKFTRQLTTLIARYFLYKRTPIALKTEIEENDCLINKNTLL